MLMRALARWVTASDREAFLKQHPDRTDLVETVLTLTTNPRLVSHALLNAGHLLRYAPERLVALLHEVAEQAKRDRTRVRVPPSRGWSVHEARRKIEIANGGGSRWGTLYREQQGWWNQTYGQTLGVRQHLKGSVYLHGQIDHVVVIRFVSNLHNFDASHDAPSGQRAAFVQDYKAGCVRLLSTIAAAPL